ncbi:uncharacterized protein LOC121289157 [Carcharodon carcharias]|uniref:uncharacterized protein LOC121289157 n=1 Tax=Carcharodon carcharias TaxID=13397 RepID=UPI001B7ED578|nr:uncharacterized protein LOC121289157 [Carcharodon carcharias]XP_041064238.1 uncharacterized protein LOC121289157 [Carcharodon carcharias]
MSQELEAEKYEGSFQEAAVPHFVKSVSSLLAMLKIVLQVGVGDLTEKQMSLFQEETKAANNEAQESARRAGELGDLIDGNCVKMTAEYGEVSRSRKELASSLQEKQNKLRSLETEREMLQGKLQTAKIDLRQVEDSLRAATAKVGEKETRRDVGIGLSFLLPCVGIAMAVAFEKERQYMKCEVDVVSEDHSSLKSSIIKDEDRLNKINSEVHTLYNEINVISERLEENKVAELALKESRAELAKLQGRMRNCFQYLTTFRGKVGVLKSQSQHMYNLRLLLPFLEEAGLQAQQVPDTEQLFSHIQVNKVVGDLKALLPKIKDLLLSEDSSDYMK